MLKRMSVGLVVLIAGAAPVLGQCVLDWADGFAAPGINDVVRALAVFDDGGGPALYAAGDFWIAGEVRATHIVKWDGTAWSALGSGTNGDIYALAVYDDGNGPALCVGGEFTSAGGVAARRIAKWDGVSWSALGSGMEGGPYPCRVHALTVFDDGTGPLLYAGGSFTEAGGVTAWGIAQWDGVGWSHVGGSMTGRVYGLTVHDDGSGPALYAAGAFSHAGGVPALNVAKWDGSNWSGLGTGLSGAYPPHARSLTTYDDGSGPCLYVGGRFDIAGAVSANYVAKWDGSAWSALGTGLGGVFHPEGHSLTVFDDGSGPALYVGGEFTIAGGVDADYVAKWDGSNWSALGSGMAGGTTRGPNVFAWAVFDDGNGPALYAAGNFESADGVGANYVAKWDGGTFSSLSTGNGMSNRVFTLEIHDDGSGPALYAGGDFRAAGASGANCIAGWDGSGWSPLGEGVNNFVGALTVFDDGSGPALYAGGGFYTAGGVDANCIAKWDGTTWSPLGSALSEGQLVAALAVYDDGNGPALYVGGRFEIAGGVSANHIAKWDGSSWSALGSGMSGDSMTVVAALAVYDDATGPALYAGGYFRTAGGLRVNHIARWDGTSWSPLGSGMSGHSQPRVYSLTVFNGGSGPALYVGGYFEFGDGVRADGLAKWDGEHFSAVGGGLSSPASVHALTVHDDGGGPALYASGWFQSAGGTIVHDIAKWDGTSWSALGSGFSYGSADALAGFDDGSGPALYAGGDLIYAGGRVSARIAKWACVGDLLLGDANCDGTVDHLDIDAFVMALVSPSVYELTYPDCDIRTADCNYDGSIDAFDIDPFVELLTGR